MTQEEHYGLKARLLEGTQVVNHSGPLLGDKGRVGTIGTVGTAESRGCFGVEVAIAIAIGEGVGFEIGIVLQMMSSMIQLVEIKKFNLAVHSPIIET